MITPTQRHSRRWVLVTTRIRGGLIIKAALVIAAQVLVTTRIRGGLILPRRIHHLALVLVTTRIRGGLIRSVARH